MEQIAQKLLALGFSNIEVISEKKTIVTVKIRTSKGWTYEKFDSADPAAVDLWAIKHSPE